MKEFFKTMIDGFNRSSLVLDVIIFIIWWIAVAIIQETSMSAIVLIYWIAIIYKWRDIIFPK